MTRAKDISKIVTDADLSGTLDVAGTVTVDGNLNLVGSTSQNIALERSGVSKIEIGASTAAVGNYINATTNDLFIKRTASFLKVLGIDNSTGDISFYEDTGTTPKLFWDASAESLGIGTVSPSVALDVTGGNSILSRAAFTRTDTSSTLEAGAWFTSGPYVGSATNHPLQIITNNTERMRIDSSGNLLVGKTSTGAENVGITLGSSGYASFTRDSNIALFLNRETNDGTIVEFRKDNSAVGVISTASGYLAIGDDCGILFNNANPSFTPFNAVNRTNSDNSVDLGASNARFDDIYATNSTIQTSDRNEKQDIEELSEAEQRVAVVAKGLMRKFRWIDSVAEKGDNARTHFGIIAQDLQDAFTAEGLDASKYAMFTSNTWWELDGKIYETEEEAPEGATEKTRLGVRYNQLLAFIISAI